MFVASKGEPVQHFMILGPHQDFLPQRAFGRAGRCWRGRRRCLDVKLIHLRFNDLTEVLNIDSRFYFRELSINFDSAIPICPNQVLTHLRHRKILRLGIPNHICSPYICYSSVTFTRAHIPSAAPMCFHQWPRCSNTCCLEK